MKVTILQHNIVWARPEENRQRLEQQIDRQPGADLYVLAEMWPTGFATEPEDIAERDETSLRWMQQTAQRHNAALAGSIAVEEDGKFYNRLYFVRPDGSMEHYDKRHLFTYAGEDKHFTRGNRRVVVAWRGVRLLLEVCYDLRFRVEAWSTLLRARAIENQCYVVGVNRIGEDPNCEYCGCSAIIDPYGRTLAECERDQECLAEAELDMEALRAFRAKFPVLQDADRLRIED